jgi:hypothetical protein
MGSERDVTVKFVCCVCGVNVKCVEVRLTQKQVDQ